MTRNKNIKEYIDVLGDIPQFLEKYLKLRILTRLKKVGYFCGMDYASPHVYMFEYKISRFDHSLTTALMTWKYSKDKKATLAALFHDVSTPCFSHVIDYMNKDYENQESTEEKTESILKNCKSLKKLLKEDDLSLDDILDFKKFTIVDNHRPKLCADRIDGIILTSLGWTKTLTMEEVPSILGYKPFVVMSNSMKDEFEKGDLIISKVTPYDELEEGDYIKGIQGGILYLGNILQNGSVSKEYLGSSAGSDATPLDTDLSRIMTSEGTNRDKILLTEASTYGNIWFVLKNDDRFQVTRGEEQVEEQDIKRSDKLEVFLTGVVGKGHYGIRTGFSSSDINYIVVEKYDEKVAMEIVINGFYIPIADKDGKIIFTNTTFKKLFNLFKEI